MASCLSSFFLFLGGGGDIKQRVLWFGKVYVRSLSAFLGYTLLTSCDRFLSVNSHRWALELLMPDINNATFALSFRRPNCGSFLVYQVTQGFHWMECSHSIFIYHIDWIVSNQDPWNAWGCWCGLLLCFPGTAHARLQVSILSKNDQ